MISEKRMGSETSYSLSDIRLGLFVNMLFVSAIVSKEGENVFGAMMTDGNIGNGVLCPFNGFSSFGFFLFR